LLYSAFNARRAYLLNVKLLIHSYFYTVKRKVRREIIDVMVVPNPSQALVNHSKASHHHELQQQEPHELDVLEGLLKEVNSPCPDAKQWLTFICLVIASETDNSLNSCPSTTYGTLWLI